LHHLGEGATSASHGSVHVDGWRASDVEVAEAVVQARWPWHRRCRGGRRWRAALVNSTAASAAAKQGCAVAAVLACSRRRGGVLLCARASPSRPPRRTAGGRPPAFNRQAYKQQPCAGPFECGAEPCQAGCTLSSFLAYAKAPPECPAGPQGNLTALSRSGGRAPNGGLRPGVRRPRS
jgi:hypothetical protein